jgi:hypothetical protein
MYTAGIQMAPEDNLLFSNRAMAALKLKKPQEALADAARAIGLMQKNKINDAAAAGTPLSNWLI